MCYTLFISQSSYTAFVDFIDTISANCLKKLLAKQKKYKTVLQQLMGEWAWQLLLGDLMDRLGNVSHIGREEARNGYPTIFSQVHGIIRPQFLHLTVCTQ